MNSLDFIHSEDDLFYFETDHLALKGNKDYCDVLKTLVILSAQREKAIKDFNRVVELKKAAISDPCTVIEKIQNGDDLGVPPLFSLPKLPNVDFKKYNVNIPEDELNLIYSNTTNSSKNDEIKTTLNGPNNGKKVNWTPEEQKKLEELLKIYPPEAIEMRRYQKIADALGNRTVQQVCSRVQKYFLKLYKAGLPIPGRIPKSVEKYKRSLLHKHQRHNRYLWKPTTFFPELNVPVQMDELDDVPGPSTSSLPPSTVTNYLLPTEYHNTQETVVKNDKTMQLELLKRIRDEKSKEEDENYVAHVHNGFRCDYCDDEPIVGARWHCITCTTSVDFCTDCVLSQMYSDNCHPIGHRLITYRDDVVGGEGESYGNCSNSKSNYEKYEEENSDSSSD